MAGSIDTRTPELAYQTKPNIIVPKSDPRPVATIRDLASAADRLMVVSGVVAGGTARVVISGSDPAATRTYTALDKEA